MSFFIINKELRKYEFIIKKHNRKSATGILIYAGKRLIDKGIICWDERKKKKKQYRLIILLKSRIKLLPRFDERNHRA